MILAMDIIIILILASYIGLHVFLGFKKDRKDRIYSRVRINEARHKLAAARFSCVAKYPPPPATLCEFFYAVRVMVYTP